MTLDIAPDSYNAPGVHERRLPEARLLSSDGSGIDEVPGARAIARHYGVAHHVRSVEGAEFEADLERILDAMDQLMGEAPAREGLEELVPSAKSFTLDSGRAARRARRARKEKRGLRRAALDDFVASQASWARRWASYVGSRWGA